MAMEDPDAVPYDALGRTDLDLAWKVRHDSPIMVPEHELRGEPVGEKPAEEVEDHRAKGRGSPDDRMFHISRDEDPIGRDGLRDPSQVLGEDASGTFRRTGRSIRAPPQAEVDVGDDHGSLAGPMTGIDQKRRDPWNRRQTCAHSPAGVGRRPRELLRGSRSTPRGGGHGAPAT